MKIKSLLTQIIHKALFSLRGIGQRNGPLKRRTPISFVGSWVDTLDVD